MEPAFGKVPIEVWQKIFRIYLGPLLSDPVQPDIASYERTLGWTGNEIKYAYKRLGALLRRLRLVCSYWRRVADTMDDRVVLFHAADNFIWPPGADIHSSKHVCCVGDTSAPYVDNPTPEMMRQIAMNDLDIDFSPIRLGVDVPIAPVIKVMQRDIQLSGKALERDDPQRAVIHTLNWSAPWNADPVTLLSHNLFRHLIALDICVPGLSSTSFTKVILPSLRVLFLTTVSESYDFLAHWHFSKLRMLRVSYDNTTTPPNYPDLDRFITTHAATLEELQFNANVLERGTRRWDLLPALKVYTSHGLDSLARVIILLNDTRTTTLDESTPIREKLELRVKDVYIVRSHGVQSLQALQAKPASDLLANVIQVKLPTSWAGMVRAVDSGVWNMQWYCTLFEWLHSAEVTVVDSVDQPYDSTAAYVFRALIRSRKMS